MNQLLILSGKGGTGKTTVASAFIRISSAMTYADCDVDAPNLHLIMDQEFEPVHSDYYGLPKASIDPEACIRCDVCRKSCRFDAISINGDYVVDPFACEGCGVCKAVCPAGAVTLNPDVAGELMLFDDGNRVFSTAQLKMGSGTSGKLVSEVKKRMANADHGAEVAIIDGSPGIGCPVIASLSGVDMVLIVAEPSISGISDMERIIRTADKFKTKIFVCINKYDTNIENTERIESFCRDSGIACVGRIPFDHEAIKAINSGKTVADVDCPSGSAVRAIYNAILG